MLVQLDETRRHHEPADVEDSLAVQRLFGNPCDRVAADADVANGIKGGFRIDDPAAFQYEVECVVGAHRGRKRDGYGEHDQQRPCCEPR